MHYSIFRSTFNNARDANTIPFVQPGTTRNSGKIDTQQRASEPDLPLPPNRHLNARYAFGFDVRKRTPPRHPPRNAIMNRLPARDRNRNRNSDGSPTRSRDNEWKIVPSPTRSQQCERAATDYHFSDRGKSGIFCQRC